MVSFAAAAALAKANYIDRSSTLLFDKIKMSTENVDDIVDDDDEEEEEEEETIIDVDKVSTVFVIVPKSSTILLLRHYFLFMYNGLAYWNDGN